MHARIKGLHRIKAANGRIYLYHRKTRTRLKAETGTPAFFGELAAIEAKVGPKAEARPGTLGGMIARYRKSPEFTDLAERTRRDYQRVLDWLRAADEIPLAALSPAIVRGLRDRAYQQHRRRFANYVLAVLSLLCQWGIGHELLDRNPATKMPPIRRPRDLAPANPPWTADELQAVLARARQPLRAAIALGAYGGLTEHDAITFPWSQYDGTAVEYRRRKTGMAVWLPAHRDLRQILDTTPRRGVLVVMTERRLRGTRDLPTPDSSPKHRSYTITGFRSSFFALVRELREDGTIKRALTFHGLRHTVGTMLADAGADLRDIAAVLGHASLQSAERYSRGADRRKRASAAIKLLDATAERRATTKA